MSLSRRADGLWVGRFEYAWTAPLALSFGRWRRGRGRAPLLTREDAEARHDAVARLFRERHATLIARLRLPKSDPARLTVDRLLAHGAAPLSALDAPERPDTLGTVREVAARYVAWLEANPNKAPATATTAAKALASFTAWVYEGTPVGDLTFDRIPSAVVLAYQAALLAAGKKPNTVTQYVARAGALWRWAAAQESRRAVEERRAPVAIYSPVDRETQYRETTGRDRWLRPEEAERLWLATPTPLRAIVGLGLFAGLRLGEALTLRLADVDLPAGAAGSLRICEKALPDGARWKPKTRRSARVVPVAPALRPVLAAHVGTPASGPFWLAPRPNDDAWPWDAGTFRDHFREIVRNAGLVADAHDPQGVSYHTLRHTFASRLAQSGVDLYTIAQLLGDSLTMVEQTYAHLSPDVKSAALAKLTGWFRQSDGLGGPIPNLRQESDQERSV